MRPTPQHPHRRIPTSPHSTTSNRPSRTTYPETKAVHTDDRSHCPDARATMRQPPYAGTHHRQQDPGLHPLCIAQPRHNAAFTPRIPSLLQRTHSPHPDAPAQANLTPPGQAAHLQSMRPSCSFAQGGSRSNRGWPGHRHPKTGTPETVPRDAEAQTAPATCLAHRPSANPPNPQASQTNPSPFHKPCSYRPHLARQLLSRYSSTLPFIIEPLSRTRASSSRVSALRDLLETSLGVPGKAE